MREWKEIFFRLNEFMQRFEWFKSVSGFTVDDDGVFVCANISSNSDFNFVLGIFFLVQCVLLLCAISWEENIFRTFFFSFLLFISSLHFKPFIVITVDYLFVWMKWNSDYRALHIRWLLYGAQVLKIWIFTHAIA